MVKSVRGSGGAKNKSKDKKMQGDTLGRGTIEGQPFPLEPIGKHLRALYNGVINEPVPHRFIELLEQLQRSSDQPGHSKTHKG
jgi:hypothetical protein